MTFIIGTPHTHNAGYYRNDDTPAGGKLREADVQTCNHCQAVIKMDEWKVDGAWCSCCMHPLCVLCGARAIKFGCEPFVKKLEQHLDAVVKFEQYLKIAGLDPRPAPQPLIL